MNLGGGVLLVMLSVYVSTPPCYAWNAVSLEETDSEELASVIWFDRDALPKDRSFVIRPTGYYIYCGYWSDEFIQDVRQMKGVWLHHFDHGRIGWVPASADVFKEKLRDP